MDLQKRRFSEPKRLKMYKRSTDKEAHMTLVDETTADTTNIRNTMVSHNR